jgi:hypothetical protein
MKNPGIVFRPDKTGIPGRNIFVRHQKIGPDFVVDGIVMNTFFLKSQMLPNPPAALFKFGNHSFKTIKKSRFAVKNQKLFKPGLPSGGHNLARISV